MTNYDPSVIQRFADRLYRQAALKVFIFILFGVSLGMICGIAQRNSFPSLVFPHLERQDLSPAQYALVSAFSLIFGFLGYLIGAEWAFWLKLRAQTALCQVRIELNTRTTAKSLANPPPSPDFPNFTV